ncbi:MAG: Smr/MutS family protein [Burkholderiaceae bacterium]
MLRESLSDEFDASTLLHVDEHLSFRRPGIGTDVTAKLRRGHWAVQGQIDLHGLRVDEAREALSAFVCDATRTGLRVWCTGQGPGSPGRAPVLKATARLADSGKGSAGLVQAKPLEGGAGAAGAAGALNKPRSKFKAHSARPCSGQSRI